MEPTNNEEGFDIEEAPRTLVAHSTRPWSYPDNDGIAGIRVDLDGKINRFLSNTRVTAWPGRVYDLSRADEREKAEEWVKGLIGKVLNTP